ncbi:hypothetical protein EPI10_031327 [Gossypium australe]|uniref:Uncharacterized protein n=1 Tax=Gossypium australe TaxID=47621 RepID=A0A5B6X3Q0_9ROSI|nr:hypothetical protein EPI10_031327 [Gossypium australe]
MKLSAMGFLHARSRIEENRHRSRESESNRVAVFIPIYRIRDCRIRAIDWIAFGDHTIRSMFRCS